MSTIMGYTHLLFEFQYYSSHLTINQIARSARVSGGTLVSFFLFPSS